MAYRSIDENFWRSPKVRDLSDSSKLLYLYLITSARLTGVIYRTMEELAAGIGWGVTKIVENLSELQTADRVSIGYPHFVWVKNHIDHQFLGPQSKISPKQMKGLRRELASFPQHSILQEVKDRYPDIFGIPYRYPIDRVSESGRGGRREREREREREVLKTKTKKAPDQKTKAVGPVNESHPEKKTKSKHFELMDLAIRTFRSKYPNAKIRPAQVSVLAYGRGGGRKGPCFGELDVVVELFKEMPEELRDPMEWAMKMASQPDVISRCLKAVEENGRTGAQVNRQEPSRMDFGSVLPEKPVEVE